MKFHTILLTLLWSIGGAAQAVELIPRENGFQGYISLGAGVASVESNFLAEAAGQDLGDARIDDLDSSPDSESVVLPSVSFELSYVFDTRTQVFVGNLLEHFVRFDFATRAGVRQEFGNLGRGSFSLLTTPLRTRTWEDPYLTGADRRATDTDINGFRLAWDEILGSGLEIRYSSREIDIDGFQGVGANAGLVYGQESSDIDFFDSSVTMVTLGFLKRF